MSGLPTPDQLLASQIGPGSSSAPPADTLAPLAARLGLTVETRFPKEEIGPLGMALAYLIARALPGDPTPPALLRGAATNSPS